MSPRVMLVSAEYPPARGGVGDYTRELAAALSRSEAECLVLTGGDADKAAQLGEQRESAVAVWAAVPGWGWWSWRAIEDAVRKWQPEVLHVQYQTAAYGMHPAINLLPLFLKVRQVKVPVVTTFHDLRVPYLFPKAGRSRHLAALALASGSARIVLVTAEHWWDPPLRWLRGREPRLAERAHLIPIGSNIRAAPPPDFERRTWRARVGASANTTLLAFFGFLNPSKGVETLFASVRLLLRKGADVRLVMVGGTGESNAGELAYRTRVEALAREWGLEEVIVWTGYSDSSTVSGYLLSCDIVVLPFRDGATLQRGTLLAALAHGLPVVSSPPPPTHLASGDRRLGLPDGWAEFGDALRHGENIWWAEEDSAEGYERAISHLANAPELRAKLAAGGRSVAGRLSWDAIAARHLDLYARL